VIPLIKPSVEIKAAQLFNSQANKSARVDGRGANNTHWSSSSKRPRARDAGAAALAAVQRRGATASSRSLDH
jgi:hypothetical protein